MLNLQKRLKWNPLIVIRGAVRVGSKVVTVRFKHFNSCDPDLRRSGRAESHDYTILIRMTAQAFVCLWERETERKWWCDNQRGTCLSVCQSHVLLVIFSQSFFREHRRLFGAKSHGESHLNPPRIQLKESEPKCNLLISLIFTQTRMLSISCFLI